MDVERSRGLGDVYKRQPMKTGRKNKKKAGLNVDFVQQKLALVNDTSSRERKK